MTRWMISPLRLDLPPIVVRVLGALGGLLLMTFDESVDDDDDDDDDHGKNDENDGLTCSKTHKKPDDVCPTEHSKHINI